MRKQSGTLGLEVGVDMRGDHLGVCMQQVKSEGPVDVVLKRDNHMRG